MSALVTPRRQHGGSARTIESAATGHRIRLVRAHPGDVDRAVYLVTDDGLVELGTVTSFGAGRFYALPPRGVDGGWAADSMQAGALALDLHVLATPVTTYLVTPRPDHEVVALTLGGVTKESTDAPHHA